MRVGTDPTETTTERMRYGITLSGGTRHIARPGTLVPKNNGDVTATALCRGNVQLWWTSTEPGAFEYHKLCDACDAKARA